jgi:hypothetical protein
MVAMHVGDEDPAEPTMAQASLAQLQLRAFTTIEEQHPPFI